jgi:hypothetical protein
MEVKKLQLGFGVLSLLLVISFILMLSLFAYIAAVEIGIWTLIPISIMTMILNTERKKIGLTLHDSFVVDPVCYRDAKWVMAPGNYDYKLEENVNRYSGNARYIVLVRPGGKHGFTFLKEAYLISEYESDLQDELLDLQIASPEAARKVVRMIQKEVRDAKSGFWRVERREKEVEEYRELFLS